MSGARVTFSTPQQRKSFVRLAKKFRDEGAICLFLAGSCMRGENTSTSDADLGAEFPYLTQPIVYRQEGNIHVIAMPTEPTSNEIIEEIRKTGRTFWKRR